MRECSYRRGCWQWAFGDDKLCYFHSKRRNPPEKSGTERDLWTSEALAIKDAETLLTRAKAALVPGDGRRREGPGGSRLSAR